MKKAIACLLVGVLLTGTLGTAMAAEGGTRSGVISFFAGCCFGIRTGAAYNDGKDLHFREWGLLIPFAGWIIAIWNGIDCAGGITTEQLAAQYGSIYY